MRFLRRPKPASRSIAVFCGAFHPPTVAHVALARAARERVDEVLWVLPERFPHKSYDLVPLPMRLRIVLEATEDSVAISQESLFFPIAAEASASTGANIRLLIGEDGARRVVEWDYGLEGAAHEDYLAARLQQFPVLSVRRQESWQAPECVREFFDWLDVDPSIASVSSTLVRQQIASGLAWQHLVPPSIEKRVAEIYASGGIVKGQ